MTASESTSPISVQDEAAPRDALVTAQDQYAQQHVPGERMQSLSHMLKDRLSLASFRTERGWDRIDMDVAEQRMVKDGEQQRYHDFQGRFSPSNPDDCPTHSNRVAPHWAQVSPSTTMDPVIVKPKRKYTKKSSLLPQSMGESCDPVEFQSKQERNELLCADRGLIFKTQIPKKGRPISKHSSTSTQSTPTLTSIGVLPASHYYFTKSGTGVIIYPYSLASGIK
ncbi:hypothetical protein BGX23_007491 [Mortierella sp. AD031]|nr:hypothetical protein BGX23_007491 [Mortierella sp. AD031]